MRKYYLDKIRWATVVLVMIYHVFWFFNALGILGGIGGFYAHQPWDVFCTVVYPWFMALLFLIAGISAHYALEKQGDGAFFRSKVHRLLAPSTLGLFFYHWFTGFLNLKTSGAWDQIPAPVNWFAALLAGTGILWFIQMLFLFSLLLLLLRKIPGFETLCQAGSRANLPALLLLALPVRGASMLLNTPVVIVYRWGIYGAVYLLGYLVFSHDRVQALLEEHHRLLAGSAVLSGLAYTLVFCGEDYTAGRCLTHPLTCLYLWLMILAVLGCGRAWWGKAPAEYPGNTGKFYSYMARSGFGLYVVHYLICQTAGYVLKTYTALPPVLIYAAVLAAVLGLSLVMYEILRRIPVIRYITFGIRTESAGRADPSRDRPMTG